MNSVATTVRALLFSLGQVAKISVQFLSSHPGAMLLLLSFLFLLGAVISHQPDTHSQ